MRDTAGVASRPTRSPECRTPPHFTLWRVMIVADTTTEDALDSLPVRTAFDEQILPLMRANSKVWPASVRGTISRASLTAGL